jgi:hypothetical protein
MEKSTKNLLEKYSIYVEDKERIKWNEYTLSKS